MLDMHVFVLVVAAVVVFVVRDRTTRIVAAFSNQQKYMTRDPEMVDSWCPYFQMPKVMLL